MVCISKNKKTQNGDGMIDIIKSAFVESKFPGEMQMPGTSYTGPGTRLDNLAIGLRAVSARTTAFDVEEIAELGPDLGHQAGVAVGEEGARKAVKTDDVVKKLVGDD